MENDAEMSQQIDGDEEAGHESGAQVSVLVHSPSSE